LGYIGISVSLGGVTGELLSAEQVLGSARGPVTTREIDLLEEAAAALLTAPSTG